MFLLGTKKPPCSVGADYCRELIQVFPCFHCGGSLTPHLSNLDERAENETLERWVYRLSQALKKHPNGCSFGTELCVRSCSVSTFWYTHDQDGKNKNNLFNIGKYWCSKRGMVIKLKECLLVYYLIQCCLCLNVPIRLFCW